MVRTASTMLELGTPAPDFELPDTEGGIVSLSDFSDRVQRLTDLERSYRDLWKFYVFADTDDPRRLRKIQDVVSSQIPEAKNVYRIEDAI